MAAGPDPQTVSVTFLQSQKNAEQPHLRIRAGQACTRGLFGDGTLVHTALGLPGLTRHSTS